MKKLFQFLKIYSFNKKTFQKNLNSENKIVLCEFSGNKCNQVAFSYLVNALNKKNNSKSYSYINTLNFTILDYFKVLIHKLTNFNVGNFFIYKSFNIEKFIFTKKNKKIEIKKKKIQKKKLDFQKKDDLISLKINNILIGDLIYDSYLREIEYPTLDVHDKNLKVFIDKVLTIFYFWENFFEENKVVGVIVSDTSYVSTIIARIAAHYKIPTFQCNWVNINRVNEDNLFCYGKFKFYRKIFNQFTNDKKEVAIQTSKEKLEVRLAGEQGEDLFYTRISAFHSDFEKNKILSNTKKKKILIASHFFIDAPHGYGPDSIIFPDFYEWLNYLHDLSKNTDFEWYIKCHPHTVVAEQKIFDEFMRNKPNFKLIPQYSSHLQLIKEGIDCVLTVYGTIAWEYAYFKIPVICASSNNPHIKYDFCLHAKDINEYKKMILNFDKEKINFERKNIYEFYFMHNIYSRSDWLIKDREKIIKDVGGYENFSKLKFYNHWIENTNTERNEKILLDLNNFLESDQLFIGNDSFLND